MQGSPLNYNLLDILRVALKWKKQILVFAFIASVVAAVYFFFQKNRYSGYGSFFPATGVISGRINLFREINQEWLDYFGSEDEIDRAYVLATSQGTIDHLITKFDFARRYDYDIKKDPGLTKKLYKRFSKNYSINRTGYKHIEVTFTDEDPELASQVVNEAMNKIEDLLRERYRNINTQLAAALDNRVDSIGAAIRFYTDSLVNVRVRYGIYDLVNPGRQNLIQGSARGSGPVYAKGIEEVQNIEEIKDKFVVDRAKYMSLSNEFKTSTFKGFPMLHVVTWATPNKNKVGPYRIISVCATFLIALLLGIFIAILAEVFPSLKA